MIRCMAERRRPDSIAHLVERIDDLLADLDPMTLPVDELPTLLGSVWAVLGAAPATLRAVGDVVATATGRVDQLNSGSGGVPKHAVEEAWVGWRRDIRSSRVRRART